MKFHQVSISQAGYHFRSQYTEVHVTGATNAWASTWYSTSWIYHTITLEIVKTLSKSNVKVLSTQLSKHVCTCRLCWIAILNFEVTTCTSRYECYFFIFFFFFYWRKLGLKQHVQADTSVTSLFFFFFGCYWRKLGLKPVEFHIN